MINLTKYKLELKHANVYYIPFFFSKELADLYMDSLLKTIKFDKKEYEGRLTALYGDAKEYCYAKNKAIPESWTPDLLDIKTKIKSLLSHEYDVCLLNYYQNGKEGFRFHADREEIGNPIPIVSVSFGAERKFYFKSKLENSDEKYCIVLQHGSLLIMDQGTHENYIHSLPMDNKIKTPRLNLTFRKTRSINNSRLS